MMRSVALATAAAGLAYHLYTRLSGTRPVAELYDEWRLHRMPLGALVAHFAANPRRCDIVVSLTTIPSRIGRIDGTLKSLLRQRVRPREIRLNVPFRSGRERRAYEIPDWLRGIPGLVLHRCEDHGPATKLIPSLECLDADTPVLVLDDDRIYGPDLVAEMAAWSQRFPAAAICASGWRVPDDLTDRPTTVIAALTGAKYVPLVATVVRRPTVVDIFQGQKGYLVRPRFFDLAAVKDFSGAPPQAFYCDDVWLSAHARAPKLVCPMSRISYKPLRDARLYDRTALGRNYNRAPTDEQRSNTIMIRHFRDRWRELSLLADDGAAGFPRPPA